MSLPTKPVSPKATPLPPLPTEDPLSPEQWKTLLAIADAIVPAIKPASVANVQTEVAVTDNDYSTAISELRGVTPEDDPDAEAAAKDYLAESATSNPAFQLELQRIFSMYMPQSTKNQLGMVLNILKYVAIPWRPRTTSNRRAVPVQGHWHLPVIYYPLASSRLIYVKLSSRAGRLQDWAPYANCTAR
jgi:hypothetical protein